MPLISIDPSTNQEIASYDEYSFSKISDIIQAVELSQTNWNNVSLEFRLDCLNEMIGVLKDGKIEYSRLMAYEMGKPVSQAESEIEAEIELEMEEIEVVEPEPEETTEEPQEESQEPEQETPKTVQKEEDPEETVEEEQS